VSRYSRNCNFVDTAYAIHIWDLEVSVEDIVHPWASCHSVTRNLKGVEVAGHAAETPVIISIGDNAANHVSQDVRGLNIAESGENQPGTTSARNH
jgi:hypothetical protein